MLQALLAGFGGGQTENDANAGLPAFDLHLPSEGFNTPTHAIQTGSGMKLAAAAVILDDQRAFGRKMNAGAPGAGMANDVGDRLTQGQTQ